jgi:2-amino-4-hydroxy-6-hydroxymethyldihydropteridine diphosphokinase
VTAQCLISFGSNLGHRDSLIAEAARMIAASDRVAGLRTSRLFETPPIGGPEGQEPFLNAVAALETSGSARQILELLQQIEQQLGRQRRRRWDARSIDLDVVLHGELVGGGTGLIVPHPRYTARQFVLKPACDVAAHYRDPRFGWTLEQLANHLDGGVPSLALVGGSEGTRRELCERLQAEHDIRTFAEGPLAQPMSILGRAPLIARRRGAAIAVTDAGKDRTDAGLCDRKSLCNARWVSAFVPPLPTERGGQTQGNHIPRLIARIQSTTAATRWPAPHQMWPAGWRWPEYRLEIDDLPWAVSEVVSALDSMQCPVHPVTDDGNWWS